MTPDQVIANLRAENKRLRADLMRKQIQLEKAWKDRAEIHLKLRVLTSGQKVANGEHSPAGEEPPGPSPKP